MLCEAVLLATILDKIKVSREMNTAMSSFKIMLLKVLAATNTSPSLHPPPPKKKAMLKSRPQLFKRWIVLFTG